MKKVIAIILVVLCLFFIEMFLFNFLGRNFMPKLLLIFIVFASLEMNKYYAVFIALFSGFLKDSYSINSLGINMVSFLACVLFVLLIKKYIYHEESGLSHVFIVFFVCIFNFIFQYILHFMLVNIDFILALKNIMLPEVIPTLLITTIVFKQFRKCALKLFV